MRLAIALTAVLVASMALATPTTHGPGSNATVSCEYEPTRDVKWMQLPLVDPLASSPASHRAVDSPTDSPIGSPMDAIEVETREFADADPLAAEIDSFVSAVREGRPPAVGAREALDALEMAGRILECIEVPGAEVS